MDVFAAWRRQFGVGRANLMATTAFAAIALAASPVAAAGSGSPKLSCAKLTGLPIPRTQILTATEVAAGGGLPAHCNVVGVIDKRVSSQDPDHYTYGVGFAINLPDAWVGRFEMMGGGGTDGSLNQNPQGNGGSELASGWVVAADDGGHEDANRTTSNGFTPPFTWQDDDANAGGSAHFGIDAQGAQRLWLRGDGACDARDQRNHLVLLRRTPAAFLFLGLLQRRSRRLHASAALSRKLRRRRRRQSRVRPAPRRNRRSRGTSRASRRSRRASTPTASPTLRNRSSRKTSKSRRPRSSKPATASTGSSTASSTIIPPARPQS